MTSPVSVRRAAEGDVDAIHRLLEFYADRGIVLRRSREDIRERLANFVVAVDPADDAVVGCGAVRDFGGALFELRSLAVDPDRRGRGIGRAIVEFIIADRRGSGDASQLFTLTCEPEIPATPEGDYTLADPRGLYVTDAHCALALTSREGNTHAVLSDLGVTTYNFNGYFTSVRIE